MKNFQPAAGLLTAIALIAPAVHAQTVVVSREDCASLARHVPEAGVAFRPGVDLEGNPVPPADPDAPPPVVLPETFEIPITVDLRRRLGIPADPALYQTQNFTVGTVTFRDGAAWFNGRPLQSEDSRALAALCQERLGGRR